MKQHTKLLICIFLISGRLLASCCSQAPGLVKPVGCKIEASQMPLLITHIGHATLLVEMAGHAVLTDPVFSQQIAGLSRKNPPGRQPGQLPALDAILISHGHYDHLDVPSLDRLPLSVPVILPPRAKAFVCRINDRPTSELAAWETWESDGLKITAVPAKHFGGRYLVDSLFRPAVGYVIEFDGVCVYFAGDTAYSEHFKKIGKHFDIDVALLPIGAYSPRWMMRSIHMNPEEALRAMVDLGADIMIPMHYETFDLSLEPMDEPAKRLKEIALEKGLAEKVIFLLPGQSFIP